MRLTVLVTPRASRTRVERIDATTLRAAVTAPAHQGQANAAAVRAVADFLEVPSSRVRLVAGRMGRRKVIEVEEGRR